MVPHPLPEELADLPPGLARRVRVGLSGRDCDGIPKVADAGRCFDTPDGPIQVMHNGIKVRLGGYHGDWMARLIAGLGGHHEPQEEKVFHALLPQVRPGGTMVEMGAFWAYYSLWFAQAVPGSRNVVVEPDASHLAVARDNFALNGREATFLQAGCGDRSEAGSAGEVITVDDLARRANLDRIDVLHADIQGAELKLLHGMDRTIREGRVRFVFLSTHHHSICGDPAIHEKCLRFLRDRGATVLAQHTVAESFSGDGLIVASFAPEDRALPTVSVSHNDPRNSLFPSTLAPAARRLIPKEVPMATIRKFVSALQRAMWLVRAGGLQEQVRELSERVERLQDQVASSARAAEALSRSARSRAVIRGHAMLLNPDDAFVSRSLSETGGFEWFETELVEREARPGDTILDLGANVGYYTLLFARLVGPRGRVIAFEPDPYNYKLLRRNVRINGYRNVEVVNKAVADFTGELDLFLSPSNHGDHRLYDSGDGRQRVKVATTTIDDHFGGRPPAVNLIKMDIQGSEAKALRGMARVLENSPTVRLITEFWPAGLARAGADAAEYLAQLRRLGFGLSEISETDERLDATGEAELLRTYTAANAKFTNLLCVRG